MRQIYYALLAFLIAGIVFSCTKSAPLEGVEALEFLHPDEEGFLHYVLPSEEYLVVNEEDDVVTGNNRKLLALSKEVKHFVQSQDNRNNIQALIQNQIKNSASKYTLGVIRFSDLPEFDDTDFGKMPSKDNDKYQVNHGGINQEAIVYVWNADKADFNKLPIVTPGLNVEDFDDEGVLDHVFAWKMKKDGTYKQILLGEKKSENTQRPILVVTPHVFDEIAKVNTSPDNNSHIIEMTKNKGNASSKMQKDLKLVAFRVYHRHETWGRSEMYMTNYRVDENGNEHWMEASGGSDGHREIASISRKDFGKTHYRNASFIYPSETDINPSGTNAIIWASYERDWSSSWKSSGNACHNGNTIILYGRRTNTSDWYSHDPNEADGLTCGGTAQETVRESLMPLYTNSSSYLRYNHDNNTGFMDFEWR